MPSFSKSLAQMILRWTRGTAAASPPSNLYLALYSVLPAKDGTGGTEITNVPGNGFTRQLITLNDVITDIDGIETVKGSAAVTFGPNASGSTITGIMGWALWSVPTGGTGSQLLWLDTLRDIITGDPVVKSVANGDTFSLPLDAIKLKAA